MLNQVVHEVTARPPNVMHFIVIFFWLVFSYGFPRNRNKPKKNVNILTSGLHLIRLRLVKEINLCTDLEMAFVT